MLPGPVRAAMALDALGAALLLFQAVQAFTRWPSHEGTARNMLVGLAAILVGLAATLVVLAWGLRQQKRWARIGNLLAGACVFVTSGGLFYSADGSAGWMIVPPLVAIAMVALMLGRQTQAWVGA